MTNPNEAPKNEENAEKTVTTQASATPETDSSEPAPTYEELDAENESLFNDNAILAQANADLENRNRELSEKLTEKANAVDAVKVEARKSIDQLQRKFDEDKKTAVADFVKSLLPFIDTLEDGIATISPEDRAADTKYEKLAKGFEGTMLKLAEAFNKAGVKVINPALGEDFDESKHNALKIDDEATGETNTITRVLKKGYELESRIIRPAAVFVAG